MRRAKVCRHWLAPFPAAIVLAISVPSASVAQDRSRSDAIDTLSEIPPALVKCWRPPRGLLALERIEATARLSLGRDGTPIGPPMVTFISADIPPRGRELLTRSIGDAIRSCTPLRLTDALGRSIAGRPFTIRFAYAGRRGRGA